MITKSKSIGKIEKQVIVEVVVKVEKYDDKVCNH